MKEILLAPSQIASKGCEFKIGLYLGCINAIFFGLKHNSFVSRLPF